MTQVQTMSQEEEATILVKAHELKKQGRLDEYEKTMKQIPLPPYLAKIAKKYFGAETLVKTGWNLAAAEAEFGSDWLTN
jgi:hypothetical protein